MTNKPKLKKILIFSDWFLPGFKAGGPIRSIANLIDQVPANYDIVTRCTDHHSSEPYPGIATNCWVQKSERVRVWYTTEEQLNEKCLRRIFAAEEYHKIYFNSLFSYFFTLRPLRICKSMGLSARVILAPRGMLKKSALAEKAVKKKLFLYLTKWIGLFKGIVWHATNDLEMQEIKREYGTKAQVMVASNLPAKSTVMNGGKEKNANELKLVSIARISPEKGIEEALLFLQALPVSSHTEVLFYGVQQNPEFLQKCMALAENLSHIHILFLGEIDPEYIPQVLEKAHFLYAPTRGENFGHAIAEAFLSGTPVIISDQTPWRDLAAMHAGWDLPLTASAFGSILERCSAMDQSSYAIWQEGARRYGERIKNDLEGVQANTLLFEL